jgi:crotonobetainyl-CoA:carnitine CoA-transferase CaiB-like acyl-CoA transferase
VRSSSGITSLWKYDGVQGDRGDTQTIYPDHFSGRVAVNAVVGALIRRDRDGVGADIRVAQAETIINQFADRFMQVSLDPSVEPVGNTPDGAAPWNVYPCAGDDEWCVITVRDDDEWQRFVDAIGRPEWAKDEQFSTAAGRCANRGELDEHVAGWTAGRPPEQVMDLLQASRVPAGVMLRVSDIRLSPQLADRDFIAQLPQPGYESPLPMENRPFRSQNIPDPPLRPAPAIGEHTMELCADLLGLGADEIRELIDEGVLEVPRSEVSFV